MNFSNISKRVISFILSATIFLSCFIFSNANVYAEETAGAKFVQMPTVQPMKTGDTEVVGWTTPGATVTVSVGGKDYTATAGADGKFTATVDPLTALEKLTAKAEKDTFTGAVATHVVAEATDIKGRLQNTYTWFSSYTANGGIKEENGKKYFAMRVSVQAATEPYLAYLDAKMYYRVNAEMAPYIDKVQCHGFSALLPYMTSLKDVPADTTEMPGVPGVYGAALLSSKGGWVIDSGADRKVGEIRFYIKDNTPNDVIANGMTVDTWAREKNKVYEEFLMTQKLFDEGEVAGATGGYSNTDKFLDSPTMGYEPTPGFADMEYNLETKSIEGTYILSKKGLGTYDKTNTALFISVDPAIAAHVTKVTIDGKTYATTPVQGNDGKNYLVIPKAFDFVGTLLGTYKGKVQIQLDSTMADIITERHNAYDVELSLRDKATADGKLIRNTLSVNTLAVDDTDLDKAADEYERGNEINTIYTNADTDGDGRQDAAEVKGGTDPIIPPFNWYDKNNDRIELTKDTTTITGYVGNYSAKYAEIGYVQPRRLEIWRTNQDGTADVEKIADAKSNKDFLGTFAFNWQAGKLQDGDYLKVKIFTDEVTGQLDKSDEEGIIQKGYANPEVSVAMPVKAKTVIESVDNADHFGTTYTWIGGKTEPNADVHITFADGNVLTGKADDQGRFKLMIANALPKVPVLKAGEQFSVVAKAPNKAESDPFKVTIVEGSQKPTINPLDDSATQITGTTSPNGKTTATITRGDKTIQVPAEAITVKPDGTYTIDVSKIPDLGPNGLDPKDVVNVTNTETGKAPNTTSEVVSTAGFDPNHITGMKILQNPQTEYVEGDTLNLVPMKVELTDSQGRTKVVTVNTANGKELTDLGIAIAPSTDGKLATNDKKITLSKGDVTAEVPITVNPKVFNKDAIAKIELITPPKLEYIEGETFDASKLKVKLTDTQGLTKEVSYADFADNNLKLKYNDKDGTPHEVTGAVPLTVEAHNGMKPYVESSSGKTLEVGTVTVTKTQAQEFGDVTIPAKDDEKAGDVVTKQEIVDYVQKKLAEMGKNTNVKTVESTSSNPEDFLRLTSAGTFQSPIKITFNDGSTKDMTVEIKVSNKQLPAPDVTFPTAETKAITVNDLDNMNNYDPLQTKKDGSKETAFKPDATYRILVGDENNAEREVFIKRENGNWTSDNSNYSAEEKDGKLVITLNDTAMSVASGKNIRVTKADIFGNTSLPTNGTGSIADQTEVVPKDPTKPFNPNDQNDSNNSQKTPDGAFRVIFDGNGGNFGKYAAPNDTVDVLKKAFDVKSGLTLGDKVPTPTKEGETFTGYKLEGDNSGKVYSADEIKTLAITENKTFKAQWTKDIGEVTPVDPTKPFNPNDQNDSNNSQKTPDGAFRIIFDGNGGNFGKYAAPNDTVDVVKKAFDVKSGLTLGDKVPTPTKEGETFTGYKLEGDNSGKVYSADEIKTLAIDGNKTFKAQWTKDIGEVTPVDPTKPFNPNDQNDSNNSQKTPDGAFRIIFDGNGGNFGKYAAPNDTVDVVKKAFDVKSGLTLGDKVPTPTKEGETFTGYKLEGDNSGKVYSADEIKTIAITENKTFKAQWTAKEQSAKPTEVKQKGNTVTAKVPEGTKGDVVLTDKDGKPLTDDQGQPIKGTIDNKGNIIITIDKVPEGTEVKVQLTEPGKNPTTSDESVIIDKTAPAEAVVTTPTKGDDKIVIDKPTDDATKITVTTPDGNKVVVSKDPTDGKWKDDKGKVVENQDGKIEVPVKVPENGNITVTTEDNAGNKTDKTVTPKDPTPAGETEKPTITSAKTTQTTDKENPKLVITVKIPEGQAISVIVGGREYGIGKPNGVTLVDNGDGTVTITVPDSGYIPAEEEIVVVAKADGKEAAKSDPYKMQVDKTALEKAVGEAPTVKESDKYKKADQDKKDAYDKAIEEGKKVLDNPKASQKEIDDAKKAIDKAKEALNGKTDNKSTAPSEVTAENQPGKDTTTVKGNAPAGSTVIIKDKDGNEIGKTTADKDGHFTVEVPKQPAGTKITATAQEEGKGPSDPTEATVIDQYDIIELQPVDPNKPWNPIDGTNTPAKKDGYVRVVFDAREGVIEGKAYIPLRFKAYDVKKGLPSNRLPMPRVIAPRDMLFAGWLPLAPEFYTEDITFVALYNDLRPIYPVNPVNPLPPLPYPDRGNKELEEEEAARRKAEEERLAKLERMRISPLYIRGYKDNTFRPDNKITRAEVAQIFYELLKRETARPTVNIIKYKDIKDNAWYKKAVEQTSNTGVFIGYPDGYFRPESNITRAELITAVTKFVKLQQREGDSWKLGTHWARGYVEQALAQGWLEIYNSHVKFAADGAITRTEVVSIINKALKLAADTKYIFDNNMSMNKFKDIPVTYWNYYDVMTAANTYIYDYKTPYIWEDSYYEGRWIKNSNLYMITFDGTFIRISK